MSEGKRKLEQKGLLRQIQKRGENCLRGPRSKCGKAAVHPVGCGTDLEKPEKMLLRSEEALFGGKSRNPIAHERGRVHRLGNPGRCKARTHK